MYKNLLFVLLVLLFSSEIIKGQDALYINTDLSQITKEDYNILQNHIFKYGIIDEKAERLTYRINDKYKIGTLDTTTNNQIRKLLFVETEGYVEVDTPVYIHYSPRFNDWKGILQERITTKKHRLKYLGTKIHKRDTIYKKSVAKRMNSYRPIALEQMRDCAIFLDKSSKGKALFIHGEDQTKLIDTDLNFFIKDRGIIERLLFPYENHANFVILHPNGDYFLGYFLPNDKIKELINMQNWDSVKYDLEVSMKYNAKYGFFNFLRNIENCSHEN